MYDVKEGAVRVASLDVREVAQNCLRKAVAMVPQDVVLFNNTILFNVRWETYLLPLQIHINIIIRQGMGELMLLRKK